MQRHGEYNHLEHGMNWCMLLYVHKNRMDSLPLSTIANEFITRNDSRLNLFGLFKQ